MKNLTPRKVRKWFILILLLGFAILALGLIKTFWALTIIGWCVMACAVFFDIVCYRCHNCGKFLGRDSVKYCPHCGSEVE